MAFAACPTCLLSNTDPVAEQSGTRGLQRGWAALGLNPTAAISWAGGEPGLSTEPPAAVGTLLPFSRGPAVLALSIKGLILPLPPRALPGECRAALSCPLSHAQTCSDFMGRWKCFLCQV